MSKGMKMINNKIWISLACFLIPILGISQPLLEKSAAVKLALEQNYNLQMVNNQLEIAKNNTDIFNTGYLPTVSANAGGTLDFGGTKITFADGHVQDVSAAATQRYNASLGANYVIYDGKRRYYNLENLKVARSIAELNVRQSVEGVLLQLFSAYYEVAKVTLDVKAQEETMEVSKKRLQRAQYQFDYGQGSRLNVLNAEVDINRDSINYRNLVRLLANTKRNLNVILNNRIINEFVVDTTVLYTEGLSLEDLITKSKSNNVDLLIAEQGIYQSNYTLKQFEANKMPTVSTNLSYGWNLTDNPLSDNPNPFQTDLIRSNGLNLGVTASWNIFDGGTTRTQVQNAKISIMTQELNKASLDQAVERDVLNAWETYQNALFVLKAEEKNLETNQLNFSFTEDQFQIGQVSSVEYRQAQLNLLNAQRSYNQAKFDAKILELNLLQLSGDLIGAQY
ncbi:MAG: TolC family protein [Bacteroidetes bacterium]|nr:MAG: TolC family protein [Bacteroidota bacterium]